MVNIDTLSLSSLSHHFSQSKNYHFHLYQNNNLFLFYVQRYEFFYLVIIEKKVYT